MYCDVTRTRAHTDVWYAAYCRHFNSRLAGEDALRAELSELKAQLVRASLLPDFALLLLCVGCVVALIVTAAKKSCVGMFGYRGMCGIELPMRHTVRIRRILQGSGGVYGERYGVLTNG